jgi:hypothetical protein
MKPEAQVYNTSTLTAQTREIKTKITARKENSFHIIAVRPSQIFSSQQKGEKHLSRK